MLQGEVDWIDLLAYSALVVKAPATVAKMRDAPDDFLGRGVVQDQQSGDTTAEQWFGSIVPASEQNKAVKELLAFLFPRTFEEYAAPSQHPDALSQRRPFLTALRLGLLPGAYSREDIQCLVREAPDQIGLKLKDAFELGRIRQLADRLDELYTDIESFDHIYFWQGVAAFAKKPDCEWMTSYQPMDDAIRGLVSVLEEAVQRKPELREPAATVFRNLRGSDELELTAYWLRSHFFIYGLYGRERRGGEHWFLTAEQAEALGLEMARSCRVDHLAGKLIPCLWGLQAVYMMFDTGVWDQPCRDWLDKALVDDRALDGLTLLLFSRSSHERSTLDQLFDYQAYLERVRSRLNSANHDNMHDSVRIALRRALGDRT